ncbi:MAG: hypothetical protein H6668_19850 [Ardenticatenaceae bacterium]|nr:hypothetical protein [Ardenticatenaceae bacterium]
MFAWIERADVISDHATPREAPGEKLLNWAQGKLFEQVVAQQPPIFIRPHRQ